MPTPPPPVAQQDDARFRLAMADSADWRQVLVVTHWGFIRGLTGRSVENGTLLSFDPTLA